MSWSRASGSGIAAAVASEAEHAVSASSMSEAIIPRMRK
jgi:hypothetical protein